MELKSYKNVIDCHELSKTMNTKFEAFQHNLVCQYKSNMSNMINNYQNINSNNTLSPIATIYTSQESLIIHYNCNLRLKEYPKSTIIKSLLP